MVLTDVVHVHKARLSRTTDWNNDFEVGAHDPSAVERLPSATRLSWEWLLVHAL